MSKQETRTCTACNKAKPLTSTHFAIYGRGHLNTCRPCYAKTKIGKKRQFGELPRRVTGRLKVVPEVIEYETIVPEREHALRFAIEKLVMLQDELTRTHATCRQLELQLEAKVTQLAESEESLELARMEIEELEQKLQKAATRQAPQGLTSSERAALADFGYRPAAV